MDIGFIKGYNGVSYGITYTVTAQDVTDGYVEGSFAGPSNVEGLPYPMAFGILVEDGSNVNVPLADASLTFNARSGDTENGYFRIADGAATFALVAGQIIHIVAQPSRLDNSIQ